MRLTLILICLLSVLGGCAASSSHGVVVPKLVSYSGKQQPALHLTRNTHQASIAADATARYLDVDDIEDEDDIDKLGSRKFKVVIRYVSAYAQPMDLNGLRRCGFSIASVEGNASPIYIEQQTIRV